MIIHIGFTGTTLWDDRSTTPRSLAWLIQFQSKVIIFWADGRMEYSFRPKKWRRARKKKTKL